MLRGCEVPANRDGSQVIDLRPVRARSHDFAVPVELCCGAAAGAAVAAVAAAGALVGVAVAVWFVRWARRPVGTRRQRRRAEQEKLVS